MDSSAHNLNRLFDQLGMPSSDLSIVEFVVEHRPLHDDISLEDADFWTRPQAQFLHDAIAQASDWASAVDQLDAQLRH